MKHNQYLLLTISIIAAILIASCSPSAAPTQDTFVQTAVAQTVVAKSATENAPAPTPVIEATQTPAQFSPTLTALPNPSAQTNTGAANACASASLVSETIVDGTIFKPGEQFIKTWEIKNTSTCTWDTNYRIVFWNGDILGGAYYYNLPQVVAPGATVPISVLLAAPTTDGDYTSKWMLQTPDKVNFGVGQYSASFYAHIQVSSLEKPEYGVTSVTYKMARTPPIGCPANVTYTAYATVTTNGPLTFKYYWAQSDGHNVKNSDIIKVEKAGTVELSNSWQLHIATNPGTRWMALVIATPNGEDYIYTEYPRVEFTKDCGS